MKNLRTWQALLVASQIGFVLAAGVAIGLFLGWYLDSVLNTSPIFAMLGALAGVAAGIHSSLRMVRFITRRDPPE
jgi:ATP synthase protein I